MEYWRLRNTALSPGVVIDARRRAREGEHIPKMAAELQVDTETLRQAVTGRSWSHLNPIEPPVVLTTNRRNSQMSEDNVREIRQRYEAGESITSLARAYKKTAPTISRVIKRKAWHHVD